MFLYAFATFPTKHHSLTSIIEQVVNKEVLDSMTYLIKEPCFRIGLNDKYICHLSADLQNSRMV